MDKPISLSVKDYIIRKMSVKMMLSESVIESVVNHQFKSTIEAFSDVNKTIELGGLGKFLFNTKKASRKMDKYLQIKQALENQLNTPSLSEAKKHTAQFKLNQLMEDIKQLKPKLEHALLSDLRGVEEQLVSPQENEGNN
jgi:nucleoid DNA-binding protein